MKRLAALALVMALVTPTMVQAADIHSQPGLGAWTVMQESTDSTSFGND